MAAIVLIDCNNFFVSCEELYDPSLKGKPVCVLGNNDGCVVARSNPAKDLGIAMGMPYFIAKKKFPNAIYLSGSLPKYRSISKKIMQKLFDFSYFEIAKKIRKTMKDEIGIDVSAGLSSTKTLAKLASEIAKSKIRRHTDESGVYEIDEKNRDEILKNTAINEIWGIGRNLDKTLRRHNVRNAYDYIQLPYDFLKRNLGKNGLDLKEELSGNSVDPVNYENSMPKSISKTLSFRNFTTDKSEIKNALNSHLHTVCAKLREHNLTAGIITIMLRTKEFRIFTNKIILTEPIDSEFEINQKIYELFDEIYKEGINYRSSGVILSKIEQKKETQLGLFGAKEKEKSKKLSKAWDNIEKKFGQGALKIGINKEE